MGSYVNSTLMKDEKILHEAKVSLWSQWSLIVLGFLLLFFYGIGIAFWALAYLRYATTELAITDKRVIAKFGFIRRSTIELNLKKVESVQVNQGIVGRIFNFGDLVVSGGGSPQAPIPGIHDPMSFRRQVTEVQHEPQAAA